MSNNKLTSYEFSGEFAERFIIESIFIRLKHGNNYLDYFNKENKKDNFDILPMCKSDIEIIKKLCESDLTLNKITENIKLILINDKLEIKY